MKCALKKKRIWMYLCSVPVSKPRYVSTKLNNFGKDLHQVPQRDIQKIYLCRNKSNICFVTTQNLRIGRAELGLRRITNTWKGNSLLRGRWGWQCSPTKPNFGPCKWTQNLKHFESFWDYWRMDGCGCQSWIWGKIFCTSTWTNRDRSFPRRSFHRLSFPRQFFPARFFPRRSFPR